VGRAIKQFVEKGGGALLYHNVTFISRHNPDFRDVVGAVTRDHAPIRPYKVHGPGSFGTGESLKPESTAGS
jgi:hypothetical protein